MCGELDYWKDEEYGELKPCGRTICLQWLRWVGRSSQSSLSLLHGDKQVEVVSILRCCEYFEVCVFVFELLNAEHW